MWALLLNVHGQGLIDEVLRLLGCLALSEGLLAMEALTGPSRPLTLWCWSAGPTKGGEP